jgi:hypothetical protein
MSYKVGYFHDKCNENMSFDRRRNSYGSIYSFMCHYHNMHFAVAGSRPFLTYVMHITVAFISTCDVCIYRCYLNCFLCCLLFSSYKSVCSFSHVCTCTIYIYMCVEFVSDPRCAENNGQVFCPSTVPNSSWL